VVHSPQLDHAKHLAVQAPKRSPAENRLLDAGIEERVKDAPSPRRRGGLALPRNRSARAPQPSQPASTTSLTDRSGFEQADLLPLLAHQLLTPLALIDTAAQRMARRATEMSPEEIEARATRIRSATTRLSTLVQAILSRTKLGSGELAVDPQACRVGDLLSRMRDHVNCLQPTRKLLIQAPQAGDVFWADPLLIEQVFTVLVCNAMKYSPPHKEIEIGGRIENGFVTLSVRDHGIGIPASDLPRIFDPFFRSQNASRYMGTGLGLNLADRIVRLHGGFIEVKSREGHGSTFTIKLPVDQ
jgi:signal transduction histidine kinase